MTTILIIIGVWLLLAFLFCRWFYLNVPRDDDSDLLEECAENISRVAEGSIVMIKGINDWLPVSRMVVGPVEEDEGDGKYFCILPEGKDPWWMRPLATLLSLLGYAGFITYKQDEFLDLPLERRTLIASNGWVDGKVFAKGEYKKWEKKSR